MTSTMSQVIVVCVAAVLLILILVCLKALWDVAVLKFYPPMAKNAALQNNSSTTVTRSREVNTSAGSSSRIQQVPSISLVVTENVAHQSHQPVCIRNSHFARHRNEQRGTQTNRTRECVPSRTCAPCHCSFHTNHSRNTINAANELQILKIQRDLPPNYYDVTKLPTFAESQQYNFRQNGTISE